MIALPSRFSYLAFIPPIAIGRSCIEGDQYSIISVSPLLCSSALCPYTHKFNDSLSDIASFIDIAASRAYCIQYEPILPDSSTSKHISSGLSSLTISALNKSIRPEGIRCSIRLSNFPLFWLRIVNFSILP